jgi:2-isopropylmalate synthase
MTVANLRHNPRLPWVGSAAFAHKGGTHVNAVQKLASSYEHINPEFVGNARNVLISDLAGRSNIVMKANELGFKLTNDTPELKPILDRIKDLENQGYEFEAAEGFALPAHPCGAPQELCPPKFKLETYHVSMRRDQHGINLRSHRPRPCRQGSRPYRGRRRRPGERARPRLAPGFGPFFPKLKAIELTDYKVRIINGATGTAAKTRVLIEFTDGKRNWGTVGVSGNIIEASLQALVEALDGSLNDAFID